MTGHCRIAAADSMFDALKIAYGLTTKIECSSDQDSADLSCARRHILRALREAGFGSDGAS